MLDVAERMLFRTAVVVTSSSSAISVKKQRCASSLDIGETSVLDCLG